MKILILGLNSSPEKVGIAVYTSGLADGLAARGHDVRLITGQPYYPAWKVFDGFSKFGFTRSEQNGVKILRCPHYVPARPSGAKRILHHISFAATTLFPTIFAALRHRPDVVMTVAPSLMAAPVARLAAALSGAKSWVHVQDFEVEAAVATGLLKPGTRLTKLAAAFEGGVLGSFDRASSISPKMCEKLVEKGVDRAKVVEFRNWADVQTIQPLTVASSYRAEWNIQTPHVALYSGNIANKQGIEIIVEAARLLRDRKDLTFVVCGEGPNRDNLVASASDLSNIMFHDLQPKERLGQLVGLATVHLLPQLAGAADLVLPSKLTNMLASGRPVVATASPETGLYGEVQGCGVTTRPGDAAGFAQGIELLLDDTRLYEQCAVEARKRALERWSGVAIMARLEAQMVELAEQPKGVRATAS